MIYKISIYFPVVIVESSTKKVNSIPFPALPSKMPNWKDSQPRNSSPKPLISTKPKPKLHKLNPPPRKCQFSSSPKLLPLIGREGKKSLESIHNEKLRTSLVRLLDGVGSPYCPVCKQLCFSRSRAWNHYLAKHSDASFRAPRFFPTCMQFFIYELESLPFFTREPFRCNLGSSFLNRMYIKLYNSFLIFTPSEYMGGVSTMTKIFLKSYLTPK